MPTKGLRPMAEPTLEQRTPLRSKVQWGERGLELNRVRHKQQQTETAIY